MSNWGIIDKAKVPNPIFRKLFTRKNNFELSQEASWVERFNLNHYKLVETCCKIKSWFHTLFLPNWQTYYTFSSFEKFVRVSPLDTLCMMHIVRVQSILHETDPLFPFGGSKGPIDQLSTHHFLVYDSIHPQREENGQTVTACRRER